MRRRTVTRALLASWTLAIVLIQVNATAAGGNSTLDLSEYRGKVVVVDFWASWCVPCRRSFPWLNAMQKKYASDGLVIIGVNVDRERQEATEFLADFPADFRVHYDPNGNLAREFGVQGMPSSFIVGRDGNIRNRHIGFKVRKQGEYEAAIVAALGENTQ